MLDVLDDRVAASEGVRFLTFSVGDRRYALRTDEVTEVIALPAVTRVPQSPDALLGIANLRGLVLPVASLRGLLSMPRDSASEGSRAIVLDVGARIAIVVDEVNTLVSIAADRMEPEQTALAAQPGERLQGSFQEHGDAQRTRILDIRALLDAAFAKRIRSAHPLQAATRLSGIETRGSEASDAELLVSFDVAGQEFALELQRVQEVLPAPEARTALPRADALVLGVTSVRGALLPLLSLRALLGFPPAPAVSGVREKVVVMSLGGARVGLVADRARAIVSAARDRIDPIPAVLAARMGGEARVRAIYRGDDGRRLISILAPEQLFREDVMQRLGSAPESHSAQSPAVDAGADEAAFVVFRLHDEEFALPIACVEEVAQVPAQITRVPKTPAFLEGVVNLRGTVLPVIDQRRRFDLPPSDRPGSRRLLVIRTDRHRAGLIVDGVSDVLRVPAASIEPAPDLTEDIGRLVRGVINGKASDRIVLVLDPLELLTRAERRLLDAFQSKSTEQGRA